MKKPKLEKLIQEIAMFDIAAAFTLHCRKDNDEYEDKDNLNYVMGWSDTPEGYKHWNIILDKLQERSKKYHPHRDLMIEYANDKTIEIQAHYDDNWEDVKDPCFFADEQYRKKPEVTKKTIECRIYLDTHGVINVIERDAELNISHFKQWLGEWQKIEIEIAQND